MSVGALAAFPTAGFAQAAAPAAAPAAPALTISGLIDGYYTTSFANPKGSELAAAPYYNINENTPTLSLAELNVSKAVPSKGGFAFKTTLIAGDTADLNHGVGVGEVYFENQDARFKNIQQLYATYATSAGYGIDAGKFYTPFGYEVTESNANYNYSRSTAYWNLLPFYELGARIYTPTIKGWTGTAYLTKTLFNGLDDAQWVGVYGDGSKPAYILVANYAQPAGKFTLIENWGQGTDGKDQGAFFKQKSDLSDTDFTYNFDANNLMGLNYDYRFDKFDTGLGSIKWDGYTGYYRHQINTPWAVALRYSYIDSKESGTTGHQSDATVTLEDKVSATFLSRLEYRHDNVKDGGFITAAFGSTDPKDSQDTLSLSGVYTF